jgi:cell division protein FtsW (lipid II flippase)
MSKAPSMFTFIGWIELPGAIVLRLPFILFKMIAALVILLNNYNEKVLRSLPKPEQNPEYNEYHRAKAFKEIQRRFSRD